MTAELMPTPIDDGRQLETKALSVAERAKAIQITDQPSYDMAVDFAKGIKALRNEAEIHHRPVIDAAHKTHKAAVEALKRIDAPLEQAERTVKGTMAAWTIEQERVRRAEEDRLRLEAEKAREAELEQQIEQAEAEGASGVELESLIEQAAMVAPPAPTVAPTYQKASGVSVRKTYAAEVVSLHELIRWVAANPVFEGLLQVNQPALNKLVGASKMSIPGVRVVEKSSVALR